MARDSSLRQEDGGNSAGEILDAAILEFDEHGYREASISRIAERAGTSRSLVTYHFPTKAMLASSVVNLAYSSGVFMANERQADDPLDAIVEAVEHVVWCTAHMHVARVALKLRRHRPVQNEGTPAGYSGWLARITDYLEEARSADALRDDVDVAQQARLLVGSAIGLIDLAATAGDHLTLLDDAVAAARDRVAGIRRPEVAHTQNGPPER